MNAIIFVLFVFPFDGNVYPVDYSQTEAGCNSMKSRLMQNTKKSATRPDSTYFVCLPKRSDEIVPGTLRTR